jgi:hypothetical protein
LERRHRSSWSALGRSDKFKITHGKAEGQALCALYWYTVRGGHLAEQVPGDASATLIGEPSIEVIERTKPEDDRSA